MSKLNFEIEIQVDIEERIAAMAEMVAGIEMAVQSTLQQQSMITSAALTVLLADDALLQQLNRDFRQEDKPTDVLSFPAGEPLPGLSEPSPYLGDIAISLPYARRQAEQQGHSLLAELQLLAVHGTLHLLGYDHSDDEEKAEMWRMQTAVLTDLGLAHVVPTEE